MPRHIGLWLPCTPALPWHAVWSRTVPTARTPLGYSQSAHVRVPAHSPTQHPTLLSIHQSRYTPTWHASWVQRLVYRSAYLVCKLTATLAGLQIPFDFLGSACAPTGRIYTTSSHASGCGQSHVGAGSVLLPFCFYYRIQGAVACPARLKT